MKLLSIILLALTFAYPPLPYLSDIDNRTEVIERHDNGRKKVAAKYKGQGLDEKLIARYIFDINGVLIGYEDMQNPNSYISKNVNLLKANGLKNYLTSGVWEVKTATIANQTIDAKDNNVYINMTKDSWQSFYVENSQIEFKETSVYYYDYSLINLDGKDLEITLNSPNSFSLIGIEDSERMIFEFVKTDIKVKDLTDKIEANEKEKKEIFENEKNLIWLNLNDNTMDVMMKNSSEVHGIQFVFEGVQLLDINGGYLELNNFNTSHNDKLMIAFSFEGKHIPIGEHVLVSFDVSYNTNKENTKISGMILAGAGGTELDFRYYDLFENKVLKISNEYQTEEEAEEYKLKKEKEAQESEYENQQTSFINNLNGLWYTKDDNQFLHFNKDNNEIKTSIDINNYYCELDFSNKELDCGDGAILKYLNETDDVIVFSNQKASFTLFREAENNDYFFIYDINEYLKGDWKITDKNGDLFKYCNFSNYYFGGVEKTFLNIATQNYYTIFKSNKITREVDGSLDIYDSYNLLKNKKENTDYSYCRYSFTAKDKISFEHRNLKKDRKNYIKRIDENTFKSRFNKKEYTFKRIVE